LILNFLQLLRHNPKHRIDFRDAMEHPWIKENSYTPSTGRSESKSSNSSTSWET
jgi:hypothetical protein